MLSSYKTLLLREDIEFDSIREEYEFLEDMKSIKKVAKNVDNATAIAGKAIVNIVKGLHRTNENNLVEGMPELSKLMTRAIIVRGAFFINPVVGLITLFTTIALKSHNDKKEREKLRNLYTAKLEFIEGKLNKLEDDNDEKLKLLQLKNKLKTDLEKLKRIQDKTGEE